MGFQPIQGDYFEKPTGLTAEDLLKWDGSALARLAAGLSGQALTVGAGGLQYSNVGKPLLFYRHNFSAIPFSDGVGVTAYSSDTEVSADTAELTLWNDTLDENIDAKIVSGKRYFIATRAVAKSPTASTKYVLQNVTQSIYYVGCNETDAGNWYAYATVPSPDYAIMGLTTGRDKTTFTAGTITGYTNPIYGEELKLYISATTGTTYAKNIRVYVRGYALETGKEYSLTNGILDDFPDFKLKEIYLFNTLDTIQVDGEAVGSIDGDLGTFIPNVVCYPDTNAGKGIVQYEPSEISTLKIVTGNPLIVFEKV